MNCEEARAAFTDLYDGTLSGPPLAALSQHLDGCSVCRGDWAAFRKTMQALNDLGDEEPSPGFAARVADRLDAPPWWKRLAAALVFPLRVKMPIHAAALVLLGLAGVWVSQQSPELQRAADVPVSAPAERPAATSPATPPASPPAPALEAKPPVPAAPPKAVAPQRPAPAAAPFAAGKLEAPDAHPRRRTRIGAASHGRDEGGSRTGGSATCGVAVPSGIPCQSRVGHSRERGGAVRHGTQDGKRPLLRGGDGIRRATLRNGDRELARLSDAVSQGRTRAQTPASCLPTPTSPKAATPRPGQSSRRSFGNTRSTGGRRPRSTGRERSGCTWVTSRDAPSCAMR